MQTMPSVLMRVVVVLMPAETGARSDRWHNPSAALITAR